MKFLKYFVIFLVVCSASFFTIGLFNPVVSYDTTVLVNKPVGHTFNVFTNPFYFEKWMPGFKSFKPIEGMPSEVGSTYEMTFENDGEEIVLIEEITGFEVNQLVSFKLSNDILTTEVEITFEQVDGKTKITARNSVHGNNILFRSIFPFMKSGFQKRDQLAYDNLKKMIENNTNHSSLLLDMFFKKG